MLRCEDEMTAVSSRSHGHMRQMRTRANISKDYETFQLSGNIKSLLVIPGIKTQILILIYIINIKTRLNNKYIH